MSGGWGVEFEFVEGEGGDGQFISSGGNLPRLQGLIKRGEIDQASRLYEETNGSFAAALLEDARVGSNGTRRHIAEVFRRSRDFKAAASVFDACPCTLARARCRTGNVCSAAACVLAKVSERSTVWPASLKARGAASSTRSRAVARYAGVTTFR